MEDITKISDKTKYDRALYKILLDLDSRFSQLRQFVLDSNVALPFIVDTNTSVPKGYLQCNGTNGTYNLSALEQNLTSGTRLIYIQKVQ